MRLPSHLLLALAGLAACEPAHIAECKTTDVVEDSTPLHEVVRSRPAVAPRYAPLPQPVQQQPQPVVTKKPPPRKIRTSICGGAPQLVDANVAHVKCGKG